MNTSTHYEVRYSFYRYNNGDGKCGRYEDVFRTPTAVKAQSLVFYIRKRLKEKVNQEKSAHQMVEYTQFLEEMGFCEDDLERDLIGYDGYFLDAKAYRVDQIYYEI